VHSFGSIIRTFKFVLASAHHSPAHSFASFENRELVKRFAQAQQVFRNSADHVIVLQCLARFITDRILLKTGLSDYHIV
jgi:hypothetical protein